ncbi:hypothetical protein ACFW0H_14955 [Pseudomonas sp. CR3202]|uniref:hypothetical protein n=1 Tax=Pseudomonas sp. CR3202 TaxID=3351532 RepID=UPI003BF21A47
MRSPMKSPQEGRPSTFALTDEAGRLMFRVMPHELTPFRAKLADGISSLCGLGLLAASMVTLPDWRQPELSVLAVAFGGAAFGSWALHFVARKAFRATTRIELSLDSIRVKCVWGWKCFDRRLDHRFVLLPHDRAELERRSNELDTREASARGQIVQMPIYYGDSFHVVLVYDGQRVDLLSVYGRQQAAAVVARLQYCDRQLAQEAKHVGAGDNPHVNGDWHQSPGGL